MGDTTILCNQRKQYMLFNVPALRYEVQSPYPTYTQTELNMRRKTEILKYNRNSSQGPRLTKKQVLAQKIKGNYNQSRTVCPDDYKIPVLSTAAGIPGPPIYLVEDRNVPLYNYLKDTNAYAEQTLEDNFEFIFHPYYNQMCPDVFNIYTHIAKLIIRKPIRTPYTYFTYYTPVIFSMSGTNIPYESDGARVTISMNSSAINFQAYYSESPVVNSIELTYTFLQQNSATAIIQRPSSVVSPNKFDYSCQVYCGILKIDGILLTTTPGFVYDLKLRYSASKNVISYVGNENLQSTVNTTIRERTTFELYMNVDDSFVLNPPVNCVVDENSILVPTPSREVVVTGRGA